VISDPDCFPAHRDLPKCVRPNGRGWNLTRGRGREVRHDVCVECGGCYDCGNGCTDDPGAGRPGDPLYVEEILRLLEQADRVIVNDGGYRQTIRDMKGWRLRE
jgi:hypothetical protein